jgi:hypothetical protein
VLPRIVRNYLTAYIGVGDVDTGLRDFGCGRVDWNRVGSGEVQAAVSCDHAVET